MDIKEVRLEIEESGFEAPHVFASLLDGEELFTQHSEILGAVYIKREYFSGPKEKANIESTAKLLIATSRGVVYVEEGIEKICEDDCGYKMKFIPYNKITCLEVDFCWLLGIFKICSGSCSDSEINLRFNTAQYQKGLLEFLDIVNQQMDT